MNENGARRLLELEPQPELNASRIPRQRADFHEVRIGDAGHRVGPLCVVEDVGGLGAELDTVAADREGAEQ